MKVRLAGSFLPYLTLLNEFQISSIFSAKPSTEKPALPLSFSAAMTYKMTIVLLEVAFRIEQKTKRLLNKIKLY